MDSCATAFCEQNIGNLMPRSSSSMYGWHTGMHGRYTEKSRYQPAQNAPTGHAIITRRRIHKIVQNSCGHPHEHDILDVQLEIEPFD